MSSKRRAKRWLSLLVIPLLVGITYGNALKAPFAYDDRVHILENPLVTSFESMLDVQAMARVFKHPSGLAGRPLLIISYGMNYAASGANPQAFREVNIAIHIINSCLVFFIALELARPRFWLALLAAMLFAVHPLLIESVTYIAGRSSSLCAAFYLAGLYATLRAGREQPRRRWILLALTSVFTWTGLLVKQDAYVLPAAGCVLIWLAWPVPARGRRGRNLRKLESSPLDWWSVFDHFEFCPGPIGVASRTRWAATAFLASVILVTTAVQFHGLSDTSQTTQNNYDLVAAGFETTLPFFSYFLTAITGYSGYYLWRFLIPVRLSVDPEFHTVERLASLGLLASVAVLLGLALTLLWFRKRKPLVAVGLGLILVSPLSAYCVFPLADVIAEHRAYIAVVGVMVIMADMLLMFPKAAAVISLAAVTAYSWVSIERNKIWTDEVLLWNDASQKAPDKMRPHVNLGALYQSRGQPDRAMQEYELVLRKDPGHSVALANMASIYLERNNLASAEDLLNRAIALKSGFPAVYLNLGVVRLRQSRLEEARGLFERAITLNPSQLMAHLDLGDVLFNQGQPLKAIPQYLTEITLNRDFEMTHLHLATAYEVTGMKEKAVEEYRITARLNPSNPQVQAALVRLK